MYGIQTRKEGLEVMAAHIGRIERLVVVAFILGAASAAPVTKAQTFAGATTREVGLSNYSAPAGLTADDVIARMLERNRLRNEQLRRYLAGPADEIKKPDGEIAAAAPGRV